LAVALAVAAPAHAARWLPTETVAGPVDTQLMETPVVVAGPRGRFGAAWVQREGIALALAQGSRPFGAASVVPGSRDGYWPLLGVDARGNSTVAWTYQFRVVDDVGDSDTFDGVRAVARLAGGRFTEPRALAQRTHDAYAPGVSVNPAGRSVVWWGGAGRGGGANVAARPGRFGQAEIRGRDTLSWTFLRRGAAEIVYQSKRRLMAVQRSARGRLGRPHLLAPARAGEIAQVGAGADGLRAAVWHRVSKRSGRLGAGEILAAVRAAGGRFTKPRRIARDPNSEYMAFDLATGPTGRSVIAWALAGRPHETAEYDLRGPVYAAVSAPGRRFGPARLVEPSHVERPVSGVTAAAARRTAVVAWRGLRPDGSPGIYASRAGVHGQFGRTVLVSRRGGGGGVSAPAVALRPGGDGLVVWLEGLNVRAARLVSAGR
jgi:hypothetical protein